MRSRIISVVALALLVCGCADKSETIVVSGNGHCHPSQALPPAIVIETIPAKDTDAAGLYDLLVDARKAQGRAAGNYRKLWDECVETGAGHAGGENVGSK